MQAVMLTAVASVFLMVPGILFARQAVLFMGADAQTVDASAVYFRILMIGLIPTTLPLAISAMLRGVGDTKIAMRYNLTANVVNIVFNYLLIYGSFGFPRLEVAGAAIATVIGHSSACAMALHAVVRRRTAGARIGASEFIALRFIRRNCLPDFEMIGRIMKIGLPSALEQLVLRVGLLLYTLTITSLGTRTFAAHQIVLTVLNMSFVNGQAFGIAASSLTGQALGRNDPDGARTASAACRRMGSLVSSTMGILMFLFRKQLLFLFTTEADIIAMGAGIMIIAALLQPFQSSFQIYAGALRGAGDSLYPAISMAIGILGIRPVLAFVGIKVFGLGLTGAWLALLFDQLTRFFLIRRHFLKGKWVDTVV
jgi:putative MATE family efflux protein